MRRGKPPALAAISFAISLWTLRTLWRGDGSTRRKLIWSGVVLVSQPGGSIAYWVTRRVRPALTP